MKVLNYPINNPTLKIVARCGRLSFKVNQTFKVQTIYVYTMKDIKRAYMHNYVLQPFTDISKSLYKSKMN